MPTTPVPVPGKQFGKFIVPTWVQSHPVDLQLEGTKNGEVVEVHDLIGKCHFIFGRNKELCDISLDHKSISKQHAAIVSGTSNGKVSHANIPFSLPDFLFHKSGASLVDLGSANRTFMGQHHASIQPIKPSVPVNLQVGTFIRFGESSRLYMVKKAPQQNVPGTFFGKYEVPTWVEKCHLNALQLHITKDGDLSNVMDCSTRHHYIFGRHEALCDVVLEHNSISKQHAVLVQGSPDGSDALATIIDLGASNGTFVSAATPASSEEIRAMARLEPQAATALGIGACVRFGESSRLYTLQVEGHERVDGAGSGRGERKQQVGKFSGLVSTTVVITKRKAAPESVKGKDAAAAKVGVGEKKKSSSGAISAAERRRRQQQLLSRNVIDKQRARMLASQASPTKPQAEPVQVVPPPAKKQKQELENSSIFELRKK